MTRDQIVNRHKWANALRSGRFKQAAGSLMNEDGYCCLGVACQLEVDAGLGRFERDIDPSRDKHIYVSPEGERVYADFCSSSWDHNRGLTGYGSTVAKKYAVSHLERRLLTLENDHGVSFFDIATAIDYNTPETDDEGHFVDPDGDDYEE